MELIIKPTVACNFACTFCSAGKMCNHKYDPNNIPDVLKEHILKTKPNHVIITGGDPLMMNPEYYYKLHDILPKNSHISMTTNLKDFYLNPDKWTALFNEPWMGIGTSFQYGNDRKWDENTVYTEEMFLKVQDLFYQRTGRHAFFIAVINEDNEDTVLDLCRLAKKLGVSVKINNMLSVGKYENKTYPRYKMYKKYLEVIDAGLEDYETNCLDRKVNRCPKNFYGACEYSIHCVMVDENGELKLSTCDEQMALGHYLDKKYWNLNEIESFKCDGRNTINPKDYIKPECPACELFGLCNGCRTNRDEAKKDPIYCEEMLKIKDKIIEYGWWLP